MGIFGRDYPAGAENDPNAPYNQPDPPDIDIEEPTAYHTEYCPHCVDHHGRAKWNGSGWTCGYCDWKQEAVDEDYLRVLPEKQINHEKILSSYLGRITPARLKYLLGFYEASWWAGISGSTADQAKAATALKRVVDDAINQISTQDLKSIEVTLIQETHE